MNQEEKLQIQERIVDVLKTVYDPEIPVDIWNLGMIYKIEVNDDGTVDLDVTFTAPNCPAADFIVEDVRTKLESVEGVKAANINLVFEPVSGSEHDERGGQGGAGLRLMRQPFCAVE